MQLAISPKGKTYFLSEDLPHPHWSDSSLEDGYYLSAIKAIELYPENAMWLILASNMAIKEMENGNEFTVRPSSIIARGGHTRKKGTGDNKNN
jgi:hypothetical protein